MTDSSAAMPLCYTRGAERHTAKGPCVVDLATKVSRGTAHYNSVLFAFGQNNCPPRCFDDTLAF